jgi:hypothetical protein
MRSDTTRRAFLRHSSAAAALTALASPAGAAAGEGEGAEPGKAAYLCVTCGTQFAETQGPPGRCPICEDERQYVGPDGQEWATLEQVRASHKVRIKQEEEGLYSINLEPKFGIGQRAFLIRTPKGNLLWDCIPLIDDETVARIKELGGIAEIAISHPHYYTVMVEYSRAFGGAPIHIHEAERPWVMRPDPSIRFWRGEEQTLLGGLPLVRTGGHFEGYQVLLWPAGAEGRGALMAGDQPQICMDPKQVSFMWSYPNFIPLNASTIRSVMGRLDPLNYDRIYGAFVVRGKGVIPSRGKEVVRRSADRYLKAIQG